MNCDLLLFVSVRVEELARKKDYSETLKKFVMDILLQRANGTFLWVSFVIEELWRTSAAEVRNVLNSIPSGLDAIYSLTLTELAAATDIRGDGTLNYDEVIRDHVGFCGALIHVTTPDNRINLVHQSVKDYLLRKKNYFDARLDILERRKELDSFKDLSRLSRSQSLCKRAISFNRRDF